MSRQDPKPGRYILPVVIAALIGVTYVFVNALPPADITTTSTTAFVSTASTVPETTTTSTLPSELLAFLAEVDRFEADAAENLVQLNEVNAAWEADDIEFVEARNGFTEVRDASQTLADQVAATTVPAIYERAWPDTIEAAQDLVIQATAVIAGLEASDDGSLRREAVQAFNDSSIAFAEQLDVVRALTP